MTSTPHDPFLTRPSNAHALSIMDPQAGRIASLKETGDTARK